eukprot:COSAG01_NODE_3431_length_6101_cov_12.483839_1_plen_135_part_10
MMLWSELPLGSGLGAPSYHTHQAGREPAMPAASALRPACSAAAHGSPYSACSTMYEYARAHSVRLSEPLMYSMYACTRRRAAACLDVSLDSDRRSNSRNHGRWQERVAGCVADIRSGRYEYSRTSTVVRVSESTS